VKKILVIANLIFLSLAYVTPAQALDAPAAKSAATAEVAQGSGVVNKVDAAAGIVNIAHEPIPALKWPAMVMDFKVTDKKLLGGLKAGQKINFGMVKDPKAGLVISRIEAGK